MRVWSTLAVIVVTVTALASCAKSPTGRNQLLLFSNDEVAQMGEQSYEQLKEEEKLSTDKALNAYVQCITDDLIATLPADYAAMDWEVNVFDSDMVNAFALPGGNIGVYRGLHEVAETPAQLAAVIGHEIGHVIADHGNARMSSNMLIGLGLQAGSILAAQQTDQNTAALIMAGLGVGVQVGVALPYSRSHESESDQLGMDYMAAAGYNPAEAADLWRNMASQGGDAPPEWLSTHPAPQSRIDAIEAYLPEVNDVYETQLARSGAPDCQRPATQ